MYEIFTGGEAPYHKFKNPEVVHYVSVQQKYLTKPAQCPAIVYDNCMVPCWAFVSIIFYPLYNIYGTVNFGIS